MRGCLRLPLTTATPRRGKRWTCASRHYSRKLRLRVPRVGASSIEFPSIPSCPEEASKTDQNRALRRNGSQEAARGLIEVNEEEGYSNRKPESDELIEGDLYPFGRNSEGHCLAPAPPRAKLVSNSEQTPMGSQW